MPTRLLIYSSRTASPLAACPFAEKLVKLVETGSVELFVPESSGPSDNRLTHLPLPSAPPVSRLFAAVWRNACLPLADAIDSYDQVDAILVFDETSLRQLTAVRVLRKPLIWLGNPDVFAKPKSALLSRHALRLTAAIFMQDPTPESSVKTLCRWESCPDETLPVIRTGCGDLSAEQWLDSVRTALGASRPQHPAQIEHALRSGLLPCIGKGSRRTCHRLGDSGLCVKCYHLLESLPHPEKTSTRRIRREITRCAHSRIRNNSCQEYDYLQRVIKNKPDFIRAIFPEVVDVVYLPFYGWGLIETLICDADGTPSHLFLDYLYLEKITVAQRSEILHRMTGFIKSLAAHTLAFYDLQNILIQEDAQGELRFRIADFEPCNRQLFSFFMKLPFFIRRKIWRRYHRLLHNRNLMAEARIFTKT